MADSFPPSIQERIVDLLRPQRLEELDPFVTISFMPIDPYDHVADIGCGPGYFSIPLAKHLTYGKLYALDILDEMLDSLRGRVSQVNMGNVEVLKCGPTDFPLPGESLDGAFLAFVTHETEDRATFLRAVKGLLKPRGWCTVLEVYPDGAESRVPPERSIVPDDLQALAGEVGFRFRWWRDINGQHYMALLGK